MNEFEAWENNFVAVVSTYTNLIIFLFLSKRKYLNMVKLTLLAFNSCLEKFVIPAMPFLLS